MNPIFKINRKADKVYHVPVLLKEAIDFLVWNTDGYYLDGTGGTGGYSLEILKRLSPNSHLITLDLDPNALREISNRLSEFSNTTLVHSNFSELDQVLAGQKSDKLDGMVLDLGLSSLALDDSSRGFAHRLEGPLDLRFDNEADSATAAELIRESSSESLKSILRDYGEIPAAGRIAGALKAKLPETTAELVTSVEPFLPYDKREKRLSQIFQALRITVNRELDSLEKFLEAAPDRLKSGGRLVIVSYHSLEDRLVKNFLVRESQSCICPPDFPVCVCNHKARFKVITKRVVTPGAQEIKENPRSRSAKLRCGERIDG